jgi:tetratricopeptide (TPR) repeat protein
MGVVYLAEDTHKDNEVIALKVLKLADNSDSLEQFRSEFRNIRGVAHPNIPQVFDFGTLPAPDNSSYFTTEYIDGQSLDSLRPQWSATQLHEIIAGLCRALAFLHSHKLLHCDLKPENVIGQVNDVGRITLLKLVDFGLASQAGHVSPDASGTLEYMAPEIIAGNPPSVATDLYALGMLIYRLATGRLPFDGADPLAVARQRTITEAPPLFHFNPHLPVGLSDVISTLIKIKPEERPLSARHVIALLNEHEGTEFAYETAETRDAYIRSAATVTQKALFERLVQGKESLLRGKKPANLLVISPRGLGKTRLIREFSSELTLAGHSPKLVTSDLDLDGFDVETTQIMLITDANRLDRHKLSAALEKAETLGAWVILGLSEPCAELREVTCGYETVQLHLLGIEEIREFVEATFPGNSFPAEFAQLLVRETLGFPAAIQAIFDHLVKQELLRIGLSGWELFPGSWTLPVHPFVASHVNAQCASLPATSARALQMLSSSSAPLPLQVICKALAASEEAIRDCLAPLTQCGWLQEVPSGFLPCFSAVSQCVHDELPSDARREIHRCLKQAWLSVQTLDETQREREVLFHDVKSEAFQVRASDIAATLHHAIEDGDGQWVRGLLEPALQGLPTAEIRAVMLDVLAAVEFMEGNMERAAGYLAQLVQHGAVEANAQTLDPLVRYAMIEEKLGHTEHAEEILERCRAALPQDHDPHSGNIYGTLAWIAFKRGDQDRARELAELGLTRLPHGVVDAGQALLLNTVGALNFYRGDADAATLAWQRCMEVCEGIHDRKGIANMYNNLGVLAAQSGDRLRARSLWEKCAELAREINDIHRLAAIYNNLGVDSLEAGNLQEAEEYYLKSLSLLRRIRSPRDQVETLSNLGELAYYRADFARAQAYFHKAIELAESTGDSEAQIEPLVYLGKLLITLEDLERADTMLKRAQEVASQTGSRKGEGQAWEGLAMLYSRNFTLENTDVALQKAHELLGDDADPLAHLNLHLTETAIEAERGRLEQVNAALSEARKVADTKWDPFTAARTLVYGLLFAQEQGDPKARARVIRQLAVYPEFLWRFHWAEGRFLARGGALRKSLDEYGRGVTVLKAITSRLSEESRTKYLNAPQIRRFKTEALEIRKSLETARPVSD